jgi:hypothetical protein
MHWVLTTGSSRANAHLDPLQPTIALSDSPSKIAACRLWNPVKGTCTPLDTDVCDLLDVAMVYSGENVWGNVQKTGRPCAMSWTLGDPKCAVLCFCALSLPGKHWSCCTSEGQVAQGFPASSLTFVYSPSVCPSAVQVLVPPVATWWSSRPSGDTPRRPRL